MRDLSKWVPVLAVCMLTAGLGHAEVRVLVDQVGYERLGPKRAIVSGAKADCPEAFSVLDSATGKVLLQGKVAAAGAVRNWAGREFWIADFSSVQQATRVQLQVRFAGGAVTTCPFHITDNVLERHTLSNVIYYFKGQRATGAMERADRRLKLPGDTGFVDLRGGWYDATGDYGLHFSQQNPASYFNTQQHPLVVWTLLKTYLALGARNDDNFIEYRRRLLDEALYGADFLTRMKRPGGSFFESVGAPGKDKRAEDRMIQNPNWRTEIKEKAEEAGLGSTAAVKADSELIYQVSYRSGGGMAIAALALASTMPEDGDLPRSAYLRAAEEAFSFLEANNAKMTNDGKPNILDDYCALLGATELYNATSNKLYLAAADRHAARLVARLVSSGQWHDYWRADDAARPFFHPSDAGLPVYSLVEYARIARPELRSQALDALRRSLRFELSITSEENNPFGLARQLVLTKGQPRAAFFFPHDTETGLWWQGENARLGSLAAAARAAAPLFASDPGFQAELNLYAWNQLHWVLGRNPFDTCMLNGSGSRNADYLFFHSYRYTNAPGGIVNGVTSAQNDEDGIAFDEGYAVTGKDEDWRWTEQWIPHSAWYMLAISLKH